MGGGKRGHMGWTRWIQKGTLRRETENFDGGEIGVGVCGLTREEKIMVLDCGHSEMVV